MLRTLFQTIRVKIQPYQPFQIGALSADELAASATSIFKKSGRSTLGAKCIYRALALNPRQPEALLRLSDFFRAESRGEATGSLVYSATALQRARQAAPKGGSLAQEIEAAHLRLLWEGKFAVYKKEPGQFPKTFSLREDFEIDELSYASAIGTEVQRMGSPEKVFELMHVAIGVKAGLLRPKKNLFLRKPPPGPSEYDLSPDYYAWLRSDARSFAPYGR